MAPGCLVRARLQRIDHPAHADRGRPQRSSSKLRKPKSKPALWATAANPREIEQFPDLFAEPRLVGKEDGGEAVHRLGLERHVAIGIEIGVEMPAGFDAIEYLNAADLDHAVAAGGIEPCRFGIEDDFPHRGDYSRAASPRQARMSRDLRAQLWIGRRRCRSRSRRGARFSASGICRARIAFEPGRRSSRPREHPGALHLGRRRDDDDLVEFLLAAGLEEQRNLEQERRRIGDGRR